MNYLYLSIGIVILGLICIVAGWMMSPPAGFPPDKKFKLHIPSTDMCVGSESPLASSEISQVIIKECDKNSSEQEFIYDITGKLIKNPKYNLCLDDNNGAKENENLYRFTKCNEQSSNQKFNYQSKEKRINKEDGSNNCITRFRNGLKNIPCRMSPDNKSVDEYQQFNIISLN